MGGVKLEGVLAVGNWGVCVGVALLDLQPLRTSLPPQL